MQSTFAILSTRYLELLLARTFSLITSAVSVIALINSFGILNPAILNFHYVELFSHFTHSNVERIHSKTLTEYLSFLILTQRHVGKAKA